MRARSQQSYDHLIKAFHWSSLLLIAGAYLAMWASDFVATKDQKSILLTLHYSLGITVLVVTLFRLGWRWRAQIPGLPADLPAIQRVAARTTEYLLYALLVLQPMLGMLFLNGRGRPIDLYFSGELPPIFSIDKILANQAIAAHEIVAYVLLTAIALHAAAALFHHYVRRDDVLNAMLPGRHI